MISAAGVRGPWHQWTPPNVEEDIAAPAYTTGCEPKKESGRLHRGC